MMVRSFCNFKHNEYIIKFIWGHQILKIYFYISIQQALNALLPQFYNLVMNEMSFSLQLQIDNELFKLRKTGQEVPWFTITELINEKFNIALEINDIIVRWGKITQKLSPANVEAIFREFHSYEINFEGISQKTKIPISQVKREIIYVLVNNIWKVCFLVRKRKISFLKDNLLSNDNIKQLVVRLLSPQNFESVKREYSSLWKFISHPYLDDQFKNISDENYKIVYRELIILTEKFSISYLQEGQGFEKNILQQTKRSTFNCQVMATLNNYKKKVNKQTIDLVSQEQDAEKIHHSNFEKLDEKCNINIEYLLQEQVRIMGQMNSLKKIQEIEGLRAEGMSQLAILAVRLTYLQSILSLY